MPDVPSAPDLPASLRGLIDGSMWPVDVDAIVRTRRRRRFLRRSGIAGAVVVIAAVVTGSVLARPATEPKVVSVGGSGGTAIVSGEAAATRAALEQMTIISPGGLLPSGGLAGNETFSSGPPPLDLTDPASDSTRSVPFPVPGVRGWSLPFVAQGSNVVIVAEQANASAGAPGSSGSISTAVVLSSRLQVWQTTGDGGETGAFAALDGGIWLVRDAIGAPEVGEYAIGAGGRTGGRTIGPYQLTLGRAPLAAVAGGLLTSRPGVSGRASIYEVWNPVSGRAVRRLDVEGVPLAVSASYVAWIPAGCAARQRCELHITDVRTGADRLVPPPPTRYWTEGAFSPDGNALAVIAQPMPTPIGLRSVPPGYIESGWRAAVFAVVESGSGKLTTRSVTTWKGPQHPSWSPDGSLVFFTRDESHVGYFNTTFAHAPVRELRVPGADLYLLAAAPPSSTSTQRYTYDGLVSQSPQHSAELCVYATADTRIGADDCSGPAVAGWDWNQLKAKKTSAGIISGKFHVVGTYDGNEFTLTQPPTAVHRVAAPALRSFKTTCPAPAGGWHVTNPSRLTFDDYNALISAARGAPDFTGLWIDSSTEPPGAVNDFAREVFNVGFTGHLDEHRLQLAAAWGGPICVIEQSRPYRELQSISHTLFGPYGQSLGLQLIDAGPDEARNVVQGDAVAVSPATQRALDLRFGKGVVDLTSELRPVG
jgi:WD40-like Beta Propeller Repeat